MPRTIRSTVLLALLFQGLLLPASALAEFGDLLGRVPERANTLVLVNVEQLLNSPLGQQEGWRQSHEQHFAAGLSLVPPYARRCVVAAQLDFEFLKPIWQTALMDVSYEPSIAKIAAQLGGTVDEIADRNAAVLPHDAYVIQFGPRVIAVSAPANRQSIALWINQIYSNNLPPLSPYLQEAAQFAEGGSPIIMAMDLTHVLSPTLIRQRLDTSETLKGRAVDLDQLAELISSLRGVTLGITVAGKRYGALRVDFGQDASIIRDFAKPLLLEVLARRGAMIDEFELWTVKVEGNRVEIAGDLYPSGTQRILSVLDAPPAWQELRDEQAADPAATDEKAKALATKQYFNSVVSLVDDLSQHRKSDANVTWGQVGAWFEKYAARIDRMPIYGVDPEMLDYGAFVAEQFRGAQNAMTGIGMNSAYRITQLPNYSTTNTWAAPVGMTRWGVGGTYGWSTHEDLAGRGQAESQVRTQERIQGNAQANTLVQGVQTATASIRRRMTEKYSMEF